MRRSYVLCIAGGLALALVATSPQRLVGDGREYLAQAINFASLHGPALRPRDLDALRSEMARFDPALAAWDLRGATIPDSRRNRDFPHFWFYALLAAPGVWLTRLLGVPPTVAFTALNLTLLAMALWMALPRVGAAACLLLFASPIAWWIDKAHTEVFTFALLTVAFAAMRERPWWSMLAAGAAATQNPPIAAVFLLICGATLIRDPRALADWRVAAGALAGLALALLHPAYMLARHHTASLLLTATRSSMPDLASVTAVVTDPSVGLLGNFPVFLVVIAVAAIGLTLQVGLKADTTGPTRGPGRSVRLQADPIIGEILVAFAAAVLFLFSFSRTTNVHHGGTPSLSRYGIWLIPLSMPVLAAMRRAGTHRWRRFLWVMAVVSASISSIAFRPSVPENSREPTVLAAFLWSRFPSLNNPIAEVFSETELHTDDLFAPVSTPGCEKVLVAVGGEEGVWPIPCYPAGPPVFCQRTEVLCYANRRKAGYEFAVAPGAAVAKLRLDAMWPAEAAANVRRLYDAWDWRTLDFNAREFSVVRQAAGLSLIPVGSDSRFILVLRNVSPSAFVRLAPSHRMEGVLVDASTGRTLSAEDCVVQPGETCTIDVPAGFRILLLAMRYRGE